MRVLCVCGAYGRRQRFPDWFLPLARLLAAIFFASRVRCADGVDGIVLARWGGAERGEWWME